MKAILTASLASLALLALASGSAFAQEGTPFSRTDSVPTCAPAGTGTVCTWTFADVPSLHRNDVLFAACSNNLLNVDTSRQQVNMVVTDGEAIFKTFPLLPNLVANSNLWITSQEVLVTVPAGRRIDIKIQSFGGAIVANAGTCSISGNDFDLGPT